MKEALNKLAPVAPEQDTPGAMVEIASSRQAQEVQAAMVVARRFPRDADIAFTRVMKACKRKALAKKSQYAYPKGNGIVSGPSIRMAEVLAQSWGNIDFGILELEQAGGKSSVMTYAWDLETNTRQTKVFQVAHERRVGKGDVFRVERLTDPRDIYEMVANQGARRLRACILGVIPGDVVEEALDECDRTMAGDNSEPLSDRIRKMVAAFSDVGVTKEQIERRLDHALDSTTESELIAMAKIFQSIEDGMAKPAAFFTSGVADGEKGAAGLAERMRKDPAKPAAPFEYPAPKAEPAGVPAAESGRAELIKKMEIVHKAKPRWFADYLGELLGDGAAKWRENISVEQAGSVLAAASASVGK